MKKLSFKVKSLLELSAVTVCYNASAGSHEVLGILCLGYDFGRYLEIL